MRCSTWPRVSPSAEVQGGLKGPTAGGLVWKHVELGGLRPQLPPVALLNTNSGTSVRARQGATAQPQLQTPKLDPSKCFPGCSQLRGWMLGCPCITLACLVASHFPALWCPHLPSSDNPELGVYVCSDSLLIPTTSRAAAALGFWSRGGLVPLRGCWDWTYRVLALLVRSGFPAHWTQGVCIVTQQANKGALA